MKMRSIPPILMWWMVVFCGVALQPWAVVAEDKASLDEQLVKAARRGDVSRVKTLLRRGANVNAVSKAGKTPLMAASEMGRLDAIKLLLSEGADPHVKDRHSRTALIWAASGEGPQVINADSGYPDKVDPEDEGGDPDSMNEADDCQRPEIVRVLLDKGAAVNTKDAKGVTALMEAAAAWDLEVMRVLLEKGGRC